MRGLIRGSRSAGRAIACFAALLVFCCFPAAAYACDGQVSVCGTGPEDSIALIRNGAPVAVHINVNADPAVNRVARDLALDLERVSGVESRVSTGLDRLEGRMVIIGVLGDGGLVDDLAARGLLEVSAISGQWEAFLQQVVQNPVDGVEQALVIVGSDRRGAIYGTYDLSERIGVSPWYWWADVPVEQRENLYVTAGTRQDQPGVRYRGFFINDEDPAFSSWASAQFGGVNSGAYEQVFELLLRLKGNYLWPAMWGKSIAEDDPASLALAAEMGVVLGTSHHEPLTRAHVEWDRALHDGRAMGEWNYATNAPALQQFWREGMERFVESGADGVITIGMRGDGDEAMSEDTAIPLLEQVVAEQRTIIADVTGRPAGETPQVWALYKEVQDYYDQGMTVPDDVILLFADDNWGQIRRLPRAGAEPRAGGYGVYYHFDYVGGPRSYKWLNNNQIGKVWQQMDLAWQRGARDLWIVNVGDIKPMEVPLTFFMEQAWDPEAMDREALAGWPRDWVQRTFGSEHADAITRLLDAYSIVGSRRKPELIDPGSFALGDGIGEELDGGEFGRMVAQWRFYSNEAQRLRWQLPAQHRQAYFQLVEHPILAMHTLFELYYATAWNRRLAAAGDVRANYFADLAEQHFQADRDIAMAYHTMNDGKWQGMMSQTHIGYTSWDDPDEDLLPAIERVPTDLQAEAISDLIRFADPALPEGSGMTFNVGGPDSGTLRLTSNGEVGWEVVTHLGRQGTALVSLPQDATPTTIADGIRADYTFRLPGGPTRVALYLSPTLDTQDQGGLRLGISLDDGEPRILTTTLEPTNDPADNQDKRDWEDAVRDNAQMLIVDFGEVEAGEHRLTLWRIDGNVVIDSIGIGADPTGGFYLGYPIRPPQGARD